MIMMVIMPGRIRAGRAGAVGLIVLLLALRPASILPNRVPMKVRKVEVREPKTSQAAGADTAPWPHPIPARTQDGANRELFILTLGRVETPLADGEFDPARDVVRLESGQELEHYYRDILGIKYYAPLDKTRFPLPPSGWLSWYYYYQEMNDDEIKLNAKWVADHLKEYGAEYIQIDDGWQGSGHGLGENRDWTTVDKRFPGGMDGLAGYIHSLGLKAGLWLAPHGQSNEAVVKANPGAFLLDADGKTASDTWEGRYLVDPTTPQSQVYLKDLFTHLTRWGYDYFKIDGQPIVIAEYRNKKSLFKNPGADPDASYRRTLEAIRAAIGPDRYLLGCWGIPLEGAGIMNGSRTGGDVVPGWPGFLVAFRTTLRYEFLHNIVWYDDPDALLVRSPLTPDQARAWATLMGLSGQALLASDRMPDLPSDRVEILRRVFPATDIRPLDLFPSEGTKRIWDLKVNHLGRNYDVVGVFNPDDSKAERVLLKWADLGLPGDRPIHVYDFWNQEYLGAWEKGYAVTVAPSSVRLLTLEASEDRPQLISTSRHITQGWVDLEALKYDAKTLTYSGVSRVVKDAPYELRFAFPRNRSFRLVAEAVHPAKGVGSLPVEVGNHDGWATLRFDSPVTGEVRWRATFAPTASYHYPVADPYNLSVERVGLDVVNLRWSAQYSLSAGYFVYLDGEMLGFTPTPDFPIRGLDPAREYVVSVRTAWYDGTSSKNAVESKFRLLGLLPVEMSLSDLEYVRGTIGWGSIHLNRSVTGRALTIAGKTYATGIGTHAVSEIEYDLHGLFTEFSGTVGIDDDNESDQGSVEFTVVGDGRELWRSGILKKADGAKPFKVDVRGVQRLMLRVGDGGDGIDYDHADWADAKLVRQP